MDGAAESRKRIPVLDYQSGQLRQLVQQRVGRRLSFPQVLDPINRNPGGPPNQVNTDLGGLALAPLPSGTYFITNLTFAVAANALPGNYTIGNTTSTIPGVGGRISVIDDQNGNTINMAASNFDIAVVPEPSAFALLATSAIGLCAVMLYRRRVARGRPMRRISART